MRIHPSARQLLTAEFDFAAKRNAENNRGRLKTKLSDGLGWLKYPYTSNSASIRS